MNSAKKLRKTPTQRRSRQMVDTILDGTARVLSEHGYARMTTNLVAEITGVSIGSIYQYFSGKHALVTALHMRHSQHMQTMATAILTGNGEGDLGDCIASVTQCLLAAHADDVRLYRVLEGRELSEMLAPSQPGAESIVQAFSAMLERNSKYTRKADIAFATRFSLRMIHTMVHEVVLADDMNYDLTDVGSAIVDSVMGFLTSPRTPSIQARGTAPGRF